MQINHESFAHWTNEILNCLLPATCLLCYQPTKRNISLCVPCTQDLPWLSHCCPQCALPLQTKYDDMHCGTCLRDPPAFQSTTTLFHYVKPIDYLITQLKFNAKLSCAASLGELMAEFILQQRDPTLTLPQCIIPVPLHYKRLRIRGFNQALEIAKPISKQLNIPIDLQVSQRILPTASQTQISSRDRKDNIKNAFQIQHAPYNHVAIVDDVITTGHTVRELSKMLHKAGIEKIEVWCIARTSRR